MATFSETMFAFYDASSQFEDALCEAGFGDFERIGGDYYDNSIELIGVGNDARLNEAAQRIIFDAGFSIAFVNHEDAWETHYGFDQEAPFKPSRGWRRLRREDGSGFDISYWPEGWSEKCREWLTSGYMRIVPDPKESPDASK